MFPQFEVLGRPVQMYGIMILTGIGLAVPVMLLRSRISGLPKDDIFYSFLYGIIGLLAGSKLLFLITIIPDLWAVRDQVAAHPEGLLTLLTGGFVFYGGIIGAVCGVLIFCRRYKLPALEMLDNDAPAIPLAHAFGRIGCLMSGCCYGVPYNGPFAITFPEGTHAPSAVPLFPFQIAEAFFNLCLFALLLFVGRKKRRKSFLIALYTLSYAVIRFSLEFLRGDSARGIVFAFSTSQWISIFLIPIALFLMLRPQHSTV